MRGIEDISAEIEDTEAWGRELVDTLTALRKELQPFWSRQAELRGKLAESWQRAWETERVVVPSQCWVGPADGGQCEPCQREVVLLEHEEQRNRLDLFHRWTELRVGHGPQLKLYEETQDALKAANRILRVLRAELERTIKSKQKDMKPRDDKHQLTLF
jgi:hypothetical protein